ncbi:MAG: 6,7-dimethyl-8-ribityllumazine synthase [Gloeobacteraceae cyanobacterium ES-bin-316]|nr:6,7-dimethyl-8-ribityllumazine synthase [Ferruginibacter sp.]
MAITTTQITDTAGIRLKKDACVVVITTEWNAHVVNKLDEGCLEVLREHHVAIKQIKVPGAFEITFAIKDYWEKTKYNHCKPDAFIALGCIIKGDTPHFEYVCNAVTEGILALNLQLPVPSIFGVLTVNTQEQADERTGGIHGHKGKEAAATAIKMIALSQSFITHPTSV